MYSSIFIGLIMKVTRSIQKIYKNSLIHKILKGLQRFFRIIYRGSFLYKFNRMGEVIFKRSIFYKIVGIIFTILDKILNFFKYLFSKISKGSILSVGFRYYSRSIAAGIRLFYETFVFLGLILLAGNLMGLSGLSIYFSIALFLIGLLGVYLNGVELIALKESAFVNFFLDIFREDKGGEEWW